MKKNLIKLFTITAVVAVVLGATVFAAPDSTYYGSQFGELTKKFGYIRAALQYLGGAIVIVASAITAIMYMSSVVNPQLKETAKKSLVAVIIGVLILVLSGSAVDILNGFLGSTDLSKPPVP